MQFLHKREHLNEGDVVEVYCSHQCNVRLTTDSNFSSFKNGRRYTFYGGFYERLPVRIAAPHTGYWNITIDLGGGSANISHSIKIYRNE